MGFISIVLLVAPLALIFTQGSPEPAARQPYPLLRLKPREFSELPKSLIAELERRGCTIPQPYTNRRANVIRGEFGKSGQTDWAVLCATKASTTLLIFWNGSSENAVVLANNPDRSKSIDWFIRPVDRKFIMEHYRRYGGPKPPPIDHHGIESGGDSASVVLYYYRGKWLQLQGAD